MKLNQYEEEVIKEFDKGFEKNVGWGESSAYKNGKKWFKQFLLSALDKQKAMIINELENILEDELMLAHTTKAGKTSRITSAIMRLKKLK